MHTSRKVVVVTCASQGIGAETVKAFHALNYRIVATARGSKRHQATSSTRSCISMTPFVTGQILHVDGDQSAGH
jgi:NAD(P)-dependent dehydrogenase (short-subunit alcohol dehydrogenase family)